MTGYEAKITYSSKELTAREKIKLKDLTNAVQLDEATQHAEGCDVVGNLVITPDYYAEVSVHNEKSDSKDYVKFVVVDTNGTKYVTGSESFITAFKDIVDEMVDAGEEGYDIEVYRMESKNYKGKSFITCSLK
jgi:hypothetical protein